MTETTESNINSILVQRLETVQHRINAAAVRSGRIATDVTLLMVSKRVSLDYVRVLLKAGQQHIGENYVQAAVERFSMLSSEFPDIQRHFIGGLQRNKVRDAVGFFDLIHSVESIKLSDAISDEAKTKGIKQRVLLQVNIAEDSGKSGCSLNDAPALVERILQSDFLQLDGLMTIGRFGIEIDQRRKEFCSLRCLRDDLESQFSCNLPHLSMGMSEDFDVAIEEGATIVRIGSALFGEREN